MFSNVFLSTGESVYLSWVLMIWESCQLYWCYLIVSKCVSKSYWSERSLSLNRSLMRRRGGNFNIVLKLVFSKTAALRVFYLAIGLFSRLNVLPHKLRITEPARKRWLWECQFCHSGMNCVSLKLHFASYSEIWLEKLD